MMRLFLVLSAILHVAVLTLALAGDSNAQNSPDCTACTQECTETARQCREAAEDRADECAEPCYRMGWGRERNACLTTCGEIRNSEADGCNRQQRSCISNCYI